MGNLQLGTFHLVSPCFLLLTPQFGRFAHTVINISNKTQIQLPENLKFTSEYKFILQDKTNKYGRSNDLRLLYNATAVADDTALDDLEN
jgi:hypothetical protein